MPPGHTKAAVSREHWTWKPQRTLLSLPDQDLEKNGSWSSTCHVPGPSHSPRCMGLATPGQAPVCVQTTSSAWLHLLLSGGSSADPRINNILFPKGSNPCPKPYSWGVTDVERGRDSPSTPPKASPSRPPGPLPSLCSPRRQPQRPTALQDPDMHTAPGQPVGPCAGPPPPGEQSGTLETQKTRVTTPPNHARLKMLAHARGPTGSPELEAGQGATAPTPDPASVSGTPNVQTLC